jgi:hypothetical protein
MSDEKVALQILAAETASHQALNLALVVHSQGLLPGPGKPNPCVNEHLIRIRFSIDNLARSVG